MSQAIRVRFALVALLITFFGLALTSAIQKSPTMDEQNHIARGAAYLGTGDPRLSIEHPPLVNVMSALPVHWLLHPNLPLDPWWEAAEWYHFADNFLWHANTDPDRIIFLARLPIIAIGLMLVALVFRWGNSVHGGPGGLLAAAFCALDPNILAHTRLTTTDMGGAFFAFLASYSLWRALRQPTWRRGLWASIAFGLALAAKLTALAFGPILILAGIGYTWRFRPRRWVEVRRVIAGLALLLCVSALTLWAIYGFEAGVIWLGCPPMPASPYIKGLKAMLAFGSEGRPSYLMGQYRDGGWWTYFPVAFAVKTPIPTLLGAVLAVGVLLRRPQSDDWFIAMPPIAFLSMSMVSNLNIGYRHLLPMLPFVALHIGRLARTDGYQLWPAIAWQTVSLVLSTGLLVCTVSIYPDFLAYFNRMGGGPEEGWRVLADSNIDWGQDLKKLRLWMDAEGVERVRLGWFGSAYPEAYGINYDLLPGLPHGFVLWEDPPFNREQPGPGTYVISVTNLVGVAFPDHDVYAWFRSRAPDAKVGYSLFIYEVTP